MKRFRFVRLLLLASCAIGLAAVLNGCATAGDEDETGGSELPWNTPQPWEGSPMIPGMNQQ